MVWAGVTSAAIFSTAAVTVDTYSIVMAYKQGHYTTPAVCIVLMCLPGVLEFPVAMYFARKYTFAIPGVYLAPMKLLCCGKKSRASLIVRLMSLWVVLAALQFASGHGIAIITAAAAAPFPIISNVLVIVFTLFCLIHLFAIFFTIPQLRRQKSSIKTSSGTRLGSTILEGIAFLLLLVTLACFAIVWAGFGYVMNIRSGVEGIMNLDKVILPAVLCATGIALRKLSNLWWSTYSTTLRIEKEMVQSSGTNGGYDAIA